MVTREGDLLQSGTMRQGSQRALDLPTVPFSSGVARRYTREALEQWQLVDLTEDLVLIVDELVTNAVRHASGPITLALDLRGEGVRVEVTDDSPAMPTAQSLSEDRTSGRGLTIIAAISDKWGARRLSTGGKSVWADLSRTAAGHPNN